MPDYSIPQIQTPDAMRTIGSMLNLATGSQNLQKGAIDLQRARETLAADIAKTKAESEASVGTVQPRIKTAIEGAKKAETEAAHAQYKLTAEQEQAARNLSGALVTDPDFISGKGPEMIEKLRAHREEAIRSGIPASTAEAHFGSMINLATMKPEAVRQALQNHIQAGIGAGGQGAIVNAPVTPISTGGGIVTKQLQPGAPGAEAVGAVTPTTVAPGGLESIETDSTGNKYIVQRSPQGTIVNTRPLAGAGQGGAAPGMPRSMPFISPEDQATRPVLEGERNIARNALSAAPIAHVTNKGILEELDHALATGTAGRVLARAASVAGIAPSAIPGATEAERVASAYDLIGKYTERNALEAAKAMGPGTNAGLEAAIKANGSAAYNPTALKKITKLNDAIVSGAEAYQPGLEKAISANPDRGVLVKREFDQAWAQNFDPRIMEIANAQKSGDKAAIADLKKSLGAEGVKELVRKARNIELLSTQGRL